MILYAVVSLPLFQPYICLVFFFFLQGALRVIMYGLWTMKLWKLKDKYILVTETQTWFACQYRIGSVAVKRWRVRLPNPLHQINPRQNCQQSDRGQMVYNCWRWWMSLLSFGRLMSPETRWADDVDGSWVTQTSPTRGIIRLWTELLWL